MQYAKMMKLSGKKEQAPSLESVKWSPIEKARMEQGLCVTCGLQSAGRTSYRCGVCEARDTEADIRAEIDQLKQRILNK